MNRMPFGLTNSLRHTPWRSLLLGGALVLLGAFSTRLPVPEAVKRMAEAALLVFLVHAVERELFWKDLGGMVQEQMVKVSARFNELIDNASSLGMTFVYRNRAEAVDDILGKDGVPGAIDEAQDRIWLLGIAFSEGVKLERLRERLKCKLHDNPRFDLRIMLLDSLRSPAVFRSFLESSPQTRTTILNCRRPASVAVDPLFNQPLHNQISQAFHHCEDDGLREKVRFNGHDPLCWLVIADGTAFYEPYTFGAPENRQASCIGPCFPAFKFEECGEEGTFRILEDHFKKLWATSDVGHFLFGLRLANSERLADRIFQRRGDWLRKVARGLAVLEGRERELRREARLRCQNDLALQSGPTLMLQVRGFANSPRLGATLIDVSENGLRLRLNDAPPRLVGGEHGTAISISTQNADDDLANSLVQHFSAPKQKLIVMRLEQEDHTIALGRVPLDGEGQPLSA
jgi:hypothetical protein